MLQVVIKVALTLVVLAPIIVPRIWPSLWKRIGVAGSVASSLVLVVLIWTNEINVEGLPSAITTKASETVTPFTKDPHGLYQRGNLVAVVSGVMVDETARQVAFDRIDGKQDPRTFLAKELAFRSYRIGGHVRVGTLVGADPGPYYATEVSFEILDHR